MKVNRIGVLIALAWLGTAAVAEPRLPALIGDHMVIQRDAAAPVWGWADGGESITVSIAGQITKTVAAGDGRWVVMLKPMRAGGPHIMTVKGAEKTVTIQDVMVGEVWVCSGQSNMEWPVRLAANAEEEIGKANHPSIRLFKVAHKTAETPQADCEAQWTVCTAVTIGDFSAVGYYFGRELRKELDVPIGLIQSTWGGTPAEAWTSAGALKANGTFKPLLDRWQQLLAEYPEAQKKYEEDLKAWEAAAEQAKSEGKEPPRRPFPPRGPEHPHRPSSLYNGMIAPLTNYAIQGVIWYQGESNAGRAYQYRMLFPAMIQDWRKNWHGDRSFPFLFVQLANFRAAQDEPGESEWAELREAQTKALSIENTGMAVTIDIGEADDIHPKNKQEVGRRLALQAMGRAYQSMLVHSGPMYREMKIEGNAIRLSFDNPHGGLEARGGPLRGFAIAGEDRKFVWADARIEGLEVVVSSEAVPQPVAVRYAWADNPVANLYNGAGLPASPFRTDDWPGLTVKNVAP